MVFTVFSFYYQIGMSVGLYRVGNFENLYFWTVSFMRIFSVFVSLATS